MGWLTAVFIGFVQGICRFLPVSVSGHMSIIVNLFGLNYSSDSHTLFEAFLHIASYLAIMTVYGKEISTITKDTIAYIKMPVRDKSTDRLPQNVRTASLIAVCLVPVIVTLFFKESITKLYAKTSFTALSILLLAVILWSTCQIKEGNRSSKSMPIGTALLVGAGLAVSFLPGLSLFCVVYALCITSDFRQTNAIRFAYFVAAPLYLATGVIKLLGSLNAGIDWSLIWVYLLGSVICYVAGYAAILFFRYIVDSKKLINVSLYLGALGTVTLVLSLFM